MGDFQFNFTQLEKRGNNCFASAYLFIQYLQSFEVQKPYTIAGGTTFSVEVMRDPEVLAAAPWWRSVAANLTEGKVYKLVGYPWIPQAYDILQEEYSKAAANRKTAKEALDSMQSRVEAIISK